MKSATHEDWLERMESMLRGSEHDAEKARWKMGYKTGSRHRSDKILQILEAAGLIYYSTFDQAWLSMLDGRQIKGIDWREEAH